MNKGKKLYQLWIHGPRLLVFFVVLVALIDKLTNPGSYFIFLYSFDLPVYIPEVLFSLMVIFETMIIWLLAFRPDTGIIFSLCSLIVFSFIIGVLYAIGIRESCTYNIGFFENDMGFVKFVENIGLALLLLSSIFIRKYS